MSRSLYEILKSSFFSISTNCIIKGVISMGWGKYLVYVQLDFAFKIIEHLSLFVIKKENIFYLLTFLPKVYFSVTFDTVARRSAYFTCAYYDVCDLRWVRKRALYIEEIEIEIKTERDTKRENDWNRLLWGQYIESEWEGQRERDRYKDREGYKEREWLRETDCSITST